MIKAWIAIFVCAAVFAPGLPAGAQTAAGSQPTPCDRTCLSSLFDDYISALKARDPSPLPIAQSFRFTENNAPLALGDGLWNTVDAVGSYKLLFLEAENGQAGLFGVVEENGKPAHLSLRNQVKDRRITGIETIVQFRSILAGSAQGCRYLVPTPIPSGSQPAS